MTADKLVTHEDRDTIEVLRLVAKAVDLTPGERGRVDEFLARTHKAAETDVPPLPEGWVLLRGYEGEARAVYWHHDGVLFLNDRCTSRAYDVGVTIPRDRLTPLRPTVTKAARQLAVEAVYTERLKGMHHLIDNEMVDAAFKAAGVEVAP